MIPAVAYYRMSSDKQETSIPDQRREIKAFCKKNGYNIGREYVDEGISGDATERRLQFQQLIQDAQTKRDFQVVLCWDQDRFGRFDLLEAGFWITPLRNAGVRLVTIAQGEINWNDFAGRLVYGIAQEGKHQFLRDLSRNVTRSLKRLAETGEMTTGRIPYGYDKEYVDSGGNVLQRVEYGDAKRLRVIQHACERQTSTGRSAHFHFFRSRATQPQS